MDLLIGQAAQNILKIKLNHPHRIGISGVTGCGKTTFANQLANELENLGKKVIRVSIDAFHNPKSIRYRKGRDSALGYYEDAHNYEVFRSDFLVPLGKKAPFGYRPSSFDLETDTATDTPPIAVPEETIFIVDGTFLFRPELVDHWDYKIFLNTSFAVAQKRGVERDAEKLGGRDAAERTYRNRYHAACEIYLKAANPAEKADLVID